MQVFYRSWDISTSPFFEEPVLAPLVSNGRDAMPSIEYMMGLGSRELIENTYCAENTFEVQPLMLNSFERGIVDFLPSLNVCQKILQIGSHNMASSPHERFLFSDFTELDPSLCVYTLKLDEILWPKQTLYTRHPITGDVTAHTAPYPELPSFVLSASPWMAAARIWGTRMTDHPVSDIRWVLVGTIPPEWFDVAPTRPNITTADVQLAKSLPITCAAPSPSQRHKKQPQRYPSSDDEPRSPKQTRRAKKTQKQSMDPRSMAKAICPTSHAPRTRAERRRAASVH
ncbi:hypothetical protein CYLTODRAFT_488041 [Cylindrobasidium torrendii FP15055 ss-10]|uniref:Uncharacterized protein n=1 Tax=Cylindrobasidium torrendii FP15055 ss-10 TaxID=1314674 RepID=A0A0D7BK59_9AGAR|nr:hypothetical protein CYLTODRAFT_488041 [Cylindrobasidium torrendii FP15055 ss-10]